MLDPPVPTAATWVPVFKQARIDFSHPIRDTAALNLANWFIRFAGTQMDPLTALASGGRVIIDTLSGPLDPGPDVVTFTPPPFDVVSNTAKPTPAPAFADFPLV